MTFVVAFATTAARSGYFVILKKFALTLTVANGKRACSCCWTFVVLSVLVKIGPRDFSRSVLLSNTKSWKL